MPHDTDIWRWGESEGENEKRERVRVGWEETPQSLTPAPLSTMMLLQVLISWTTSATAVTLERSGRGGGRVSSSSTISHSSSSDADFC